MRYILIFGWLCFAPAFLPAQKASVPAERRAVTEQDWQKAAGGLDYSRDLPERQKPEKQPSGTADGPGVPRMDWGEPSPFWGNLLQALAIVLAVAAIAYSIYRVIQQPRNRQIAHDGAEITLENLEAYIHETDLDRFLREALAQQNYPLAIRIYFLQAIKDLSQAGAIHWSKEKTNHDYLREMQTHRLAQAFRQATSTFEYVWYGNAPLTQTDFARLEPEFKVLLQSRH